MSAENPGDEQGSRGGTPLQGSRGGTPLGDAASPSTTTLLYSSRRLPDRFLLYGESGAGKTAGALSLLSRVGGRRVIFDFDGAVELVRDRVFPRLEVEVVTPAATFPEAAAQIRQLSAKMGKDDMMVVDGCGDLYSMAKDFATEIVTGETVAGFLESWVRDVGAGRLQKQGVAGALAEKSIWSVFGPVWRDAFVSHMCPPRLKHHLVLTAPASDVGHPKENQLTRGTFGVCGKKPQTDSSLWQKASTVVLLARDVRGRRVLSVVKEWGSAEDALPRDQAYADLALELLVKRSGWREKGHAAP